MSDLILLDTNYQMHRSCGQKFIDQGNFQEAIKSFKNAISYLLQMIELTADKAQCERYIATAKDLVEINDMLSSKIVKAEKKNKPTVSIEERQDEKKEGGSEFEVAQ